MNEKTPPKTWTEASGPKWTDTHPDMAEKIKRNQPRDDIAKILSRMEGLQDRIVEIERLRRR